MVCAETTVKGRINTRTVKKDLSLLAVLMSLAWWALLYKPTCIIVFTVSITQSQQHFGCLLSSRADKASCLQLFTRQTQLRTEPWQCWSHSPYIHEATLYRRPCVMLHIVTSPARLLESSAIIKSRGLRVFRGWRHVRQLHCRRLSKHKSWFDQTRVLLHLFRSVT